MRATWPRISKLCNKALQRPAGGSRASPASLRGSPPARPLDPRGPALEHGADVAERRAVIARILGGGAVRRDEYSEFPQVGVVRGEHHAVVGRESRDDQSIDLQLVEQEFQRGAEKG